MQSLDLESLENVFKAELKDFEAVKAAHAKLEVNLSLLLNWSRG